MEITYNFRSSDYRALARAMHTQKRWRNGKILFWFVFVVCLFTPALLFLNGDSQRMRPAAITVFFGIAAGLLVIEYLFTPWVLRFNYRRFGLDGKSITVRLADDAVYASQPGGSSRIEWPSFVRFSCLPSHAFLWLNKVQAFVIPFDAFSDDAERDAYLQFIQTKVLLSD